MEALSSGPNFAYAGRSSLIGMIMEKPHAPSTEKNREPILAVLHEYFAERREVLEIGSGTGQHAIFFAAAMPHLVWQTSDCPESLPGIAAWLAEAALPNTPPPLALDVVGDWPKRRYDAIFSANTLHIMPWETVVRLFARLPEVLEEFAPQLLILCLGGNDMLRHGDEAAAAENLRAMIRLAQDKGIAVVLLAPPRPSLLSAAPEFYTTLAQEFRIPLEAKVLPAVLSDRSLKSDLVHPNAKGYARIAEELAKLLKDAGAL